MAEVIITEKPDSVTYQEISRVLREAHREHIRNGIVMRVPSLPPEELEKWVGPDGKCFVAMDGEQVVGTASYKVRAFRRWYCRGNAAELTMDGVLPEWQGKHILTMLNRAREEAILRMGFRVLYLDTAEENIRRLKIAEKEGFIPVDYLFPNSRSKGKYFVCMVKWADHSPFPRWYCRFRFQLKKLFVKAVYTVLGNSFHKVAGRIHRRSGEKKG